MSKIKGWKKVEGDFGNNPRWISEDGQGVVAVGGSYNGIGVFLYKKAYFDETKGNTFGMVIPITHTDRYGYTSLAKSAAVRWMENHPASDIWLASDWTPEKEEHVEYQMQKKWQIIDSFQPYNHQYPPYVRLSDEEVKMALMEPVRVSHIDLPKLSSMNPKGWHREPINHSLAAKGIKVGKSRAKR